MSAYFFPRIGETTVTKIKNPFPSNVSQRRQTTTTKIHNIVYQTMVNTKKKNIRQEAGVRNAMGCEEVRMQFEQRLEVRQAGII